jgi:hypothetical protein
MAIRKIIKRATDSLFVNTEFDGTEAIKPPTGTTAQRANAAAGDIRFNTTTSLMEYYDGSGWKSIDSPPVISSISPASIADTSSSTNITITGDFFASGATVKAIGQNLSEIAASSVVFTNSTTLVATFNGTSFSDAQEDYSIEVTNVSGLTGKGADLLAVNASPAWTVASGSLGTFFDVARTSISITTGATDDEGATLTYAVASGSLPAGLSMSTSTGTITGTASAVGSDTTSSFTLSVTDGTSTITRAYNILVKAPIITTYTSTGSGTFSVPSGVSAVNALVVAGGGAGGGTGGGGAGGLVYRPAFPVTPGGSVSYTVGTGAARNNSSNGYPMPPRGQDSVFGTLTAVAGGNGGGWQQAAPSQINGGSGGGGALGPSVNPMLGGSAQQPGQPGDSGTYGFGNAGGNNTYPGGGYYYAGGGGGAGAAGSPNASGGGRTNLAGGVGKTYSISGSSYYYAGGGGGGSQAPGPAGNGGQGGAGGGASNPSNGAQSGLGTSMHAGNQGQNAPGGAANGNPYGLAGDAANNSGGGGGGMAISVGAAGAGGSGIVIVSY